MLPPDKQIERARYDARAQAELAGGAVVNEIPIGSQTMPAYLRTPYQFYEHEISRLLQPQCNVLELGAGSGMHTRILLQTGARVTASDISPHSLELLMQRFRAGSDNLRVEVADMESLPFESGSFDMVVSAGSLSYGDPATVDAQIKRVLRPGGIFICVDSLNNNPVYRLNRWLHYVKGNRSKSTLKRMPDLNRISAIERGFSDVQVNYFGAFSFAMPIVARLSGENVAQALSDRVDRLLDVKRLAFKFVLVAQRLA